MADEIGERSGEVAGAGDVRAGEPDFQQPLVLALSEGLAGPHDPGGDLAGAGGVGPDRFGGARPQGGEVLADHLAAAPVTAFVDLQDQAGAADLALGLGEAGVEVRLERLQDTVGAAVAGGGH
ncbi:hypothetical protein ACFWA5_41810 [Streptomyces mirabilis]|uniref:hypothetical protein n=1 Tax=Streptomyces mirabilis TaxID=68239 RepID=UPI00364B8C91